MLKLSGKPVYKGIAFGPVAVLRLRDQQIKRIKVEDADAEFSGLEKPADRRWTSLRGFMKRP